MCRGGGGTSAAGDGAGGRGGSSGAWRCDEGEEGGPDMEDDGWPAGQQGGVMAWCAAAGPQIEHRKKQWVLVDTGSDITACNCTFGQGADTSAPTRRLDLKNVSGTAIEHYGERAVAVKLTDTNYVEHTCTMNFDVAEVATPVMSVGKSSDHGFGLWIPPFGGQPVLIRGGHVEATGGHQIPLTRYNNVYYMEVDIQPPSGAFRHAVSYAPTTLPRLLPACLSASAAR